MYEKLEAMSRAEADALIIERMKLRALLQKLNENYGGVDEDVFSTILAHCLTSTQHREILAHSRFHGETWTRRITDSQEDTLREIFGLEPRDV